MGEPSTNSAFYAARPTLTVEEQVQPALGESLLSLVVHETTEGLFRCEATFGNWGTSEGSVGFIYFDRNLFDFGKSIKVEMSDSSSQEQVFAGRIMAMEGRFPQQCPPELLVLAEDRLQDLRMVRKTRNFEQMSLSDLVNQVANEHGLRADVSVSGPSYQLITQVNQSDLAFLRDCLRRADAELWIDGDTLCVQSRSRRAREEITLRYGSDLRQFSVMADLSQQRSAVVVSGWDVTAKESIEQRAEASCLGSELGSDSSGQELLEASFGERIERIVHEVPLSVEEAHTLAESTYRQMARRCLSGRAMCQGKAALRVGMHVCMEDLGPLFSGRYYVTEVTHCFDQPNGYRTFFNVERAGIGGS